MVSLIAFVHTPFCQVTGHSVTTSMAQACAEALTDTDLEASDFDFVVISPSEAGTAHKGFVAGLVVDCAHPFAAMRIRPERMLNARQQGAVNIDRAAVANLAPLFATVQ